MLEGFLELKMSSVESCCAVLPTMLFSAVSLFCLCLHSAVECESRCMLTVKQANVVPVGRSLLEMCCYGWHFAEVNSFCRGKDQIFCLLRVIL